MIYNTSIQRTGDIEFFTETPSNIWIEGETTKVVFQECLFKNLTAEYGAAIHTQNVNLINITNCFFENNAAKLGGALYLHSTNVTIIKNNTFTSNRAIRGNRAVPINHIRDQNLYRGGALYVDC